jgi:hypothetical protein
MGRQHSELTDFARRNDHVDFSRKAFAFGGYNS